MKGHLHHPKMLLRCDVTERPTMRRLPLVGNCINDGAVNNLETNWTRSAAGKISGVGIPARLGALHVLANAHLQRYLYTSFPAQRFWMLSPKHPARPRRRNKRISYSLLWIDGLNQRKILTNAGPRSCTLLPNGRASAPTTRTSGHCELEQPD